MHFERPPYLQLLKAYNPNEDYPLPAWGRPIPVPPRRLLTKQETDIFNEKLRAAANEYRLKPDAPGLGLHIGQCLPFAVRHPGFNASFLHEEIRHVREIGSFGVPIID
jgi:hypothetical protein